MVAPADPEKPERLSREDSARWHMGSPKNPMVIGAVLLFDERLSLEALEETIRGKLLTHRRFLQHVALPKHRLGRPLWRDDAPFELGEHVRRLNGPAAVDAQGLVALAGERMNAPLPLERSPWSMDLVELASGGSALIARFHHCLADGQALVSLLGELASGLNDTAARPPVAPRSDASVRPGTFFVRFGRLFHFLTLAADPANDLRRPLSGEKRVAWSASIPLDAAKSIAHARGHHLADVLLAGVAGALHRHALEHGQTPQSVRALLPMASPVEASGDGLGNHYASVFVDLPVAAPDPQARLEVIACATAAQRSAGELRLAVGLTKLAGGLAPSLEHRAVRWWARRASLVVSSLAGPPSPVRLAGQPVRSIFVWAPAPADVGLSVTFFGYAGALHVGVLADSAVIERPEELVAGIRAAIDELGRGAPPATP